jgi:hypothetical protein
MIDTPKTEQKIREFFEAFNKLSGDEKIYFLAAIEKITEKISEKDKKIFLALIKSARKGRSSEETISEIKRV